MDSRDTHFRFVVRDIGFDEFFDDVGESDSIEKCLSFICEDAACTIELL